MSTITLRNVKGSALTFQEGDDNFTNLNNDKLEDITGESLSDLSDVSSIPAPSNGQVLSWDNATGVWMAMDAPAPSFLTQDLNGGGFELSDIELKEYTETIHSLGSTDNPTLNPANGNVQTVTISTNLNLPSFNNETAGQSITLVVSGTGTATGGGSYVFAGGNKTLTTKSIVSIFYDGTTYWTSIATDFQA
jgi:hypothetical protein